MAWAILDRLLHHSHVLGEWGDRTPAAILEAIGLREKRRAGLFPSLQQLHPNPGDAGEKSPAWQCTNAAVKWRNSSS